MIRETIGEQHTCPKEWCDDEKNPEDSSIRSRGSQGGRLRVNYRYVSVMSGHLPGRFGLFHIPAAFFFCGSARQAGIVADYQFEEPYGSSPAPGLVGLLKNADAFGRRPMVFFNLGSDDP